MQRGNLKSSHTGTTKQSTVESSFGLRRLVRALVPHPGTMITTLLVVSLFFFFQSAQAGPWSAPPAQTSGIPTVISYQGQLLKLDGTPENSTGIPMTFRLYDSSSATTPLWEETHATVPVQDGLFQVLLGSVTPFPPLVVSANSSLWLGVSINTDSEMQPRAQFGTVPFAMVAGTVSDGSITTTKLEDGAVTSAKLARKLTRVTPNAAVSLSSIDTLYDVLSTTINLERETLVTIHVTAGLGDSSLDGMLWAELHVDDSKIISSHKWTKAGMAETHSLSTSLILSAGQHVITLRAGSKTANSWVTGDSRTQISIIEG